MVVKREYPIFKSSLFRRTQNSNPRIALPALYWLIVEYGNKSDVRRHIYELTDHTNDIVSEYAQFAISNPNRAFDLARRRLLSQISQALAERY